MDGLLMKYFVLKPSGDDEYAKASRMAMHTYANQILKTNPKFSIELTQWADAEFIASQERLSAIEAAKVKSNG